MSESRRTKIEQLALVKTVKRLGEDGEWKEALRRLDRARQVKRIIQKIVRLIIALMG